MTVIIGYTDGKNVTLGCDHQETSQHIKRQRTEPKVWALDPQTVIGIAGSAKIEQLFKWYLGSNLRKVIGDHPGDLSNSDYLPALVKAMQTIMINAGYEQSNMDDEAGGQPS